MTIAMRVLGFVCLMDVAAAMLLLAACTDSSTAHRVYKPLPHSELDAYRSCESDEQCVWANNGCCDCANGGEDVAVRADKKAAFRARFQCDNTPCTVVGAVPACGTGIVACERGVCVYRPQAGAEAIGAP
jgi:hypothetical protein